MSFFQVDCKYSYEEYIKMIYHHAVNYMLPVASQEDHFRTCCGLVRQAEKEENEGSYADCFYHYVRCLEILDKAKLPSTRSGVSSLKKQCLDAVDRVRDVGLPRYYNAMIDGLVNRIQKMPSDNTQNIIHQDNIENDKERYLKRQEMLLRNEQASLDGIREQIAGVNIPCGQKNLSTAGDQQWNHSLKDGSHTSGTVTLPRSFPDTSPSTHFKWNYNSSNIGASHPRRGMINLGNTCYLNSVTQVLASTPLGSYFLYDNYARDVVNVGEGSCRLVNSFCFVVRELYRIDCTLPVSPSPFKNAISELSNTFSGFLQQDANEFLRIVLEGLHNGLNDRVNVKVIPTEIDTMVGSDAEIAKRFWDQHIQRNNSVVVDKCAFQERSSIVCPLCRKVSRSFTPLLGIDVPIPVETADISIEDCLNAYCREEKLGSDSLYHCSSCKQYVDASKQLLLYSLPKILFVTIKRFSSHGEILSKLVKRVFFRKELDMGPYICSTIEKTVYTLVGVVNHTGGIKGGHYTADYYDGHSTWFSVSDERVTRATTPDFERAYILCYVQIS
uniref:ubiquitinyl hydrolase 1 n=1 Tax=Trypanosoma congolense (strain IL3000) TaxID=1068625 RepID=F9WA65_TRYCI|nr:unnamed protein product [Trypanosoma congolense IL3000]